MPFQQIKANRKSIELIFIKSNANLLEKLARALTAFEGQLEEKKLIKITSAANFHSR